jgi:hypothetical protein
MTKVRKYYIVQMLEMIPIFKIFDHKTPLKTANNAAVGFPLIPAFVKAGWTF